MPGHSACPTTPASGNLRALVRRSVAAQSCVARVGQHVFHGRPRPRVGPLRCRHDRAPVPRYRTERLPREYGLVAELDHVGLVAADRGPVGLVAERPTSADPSPLTRGLGYGGPLTCGLSLDLTLGDRREDSRRGPPSVGRGVDPVRRGDNRGVGRLATFEHLFEFGESTQQAVHVARGYVVKLARIDPSHHLDERWSRFTAECRRVVVDELRDDSPPTRRAEASDVLALTINAELIAVAVLTLPQVHGYVFAGHSVSIGHLCNFVVHVTRRARSTPRVVTRPSRTHISTGRSALGGSRNCCRSAEPGTSEFVRQP